MFIRNFYKPLRIYQWVKNLIIFFPLFFSENLFSHGRFTSTIFAFIVFCLASSVSYILNDIVDIKKDLLHPVKRLRPIASGKVSRSQAIIIAGILIVIGVTISMLYLDIKVIEVIGGYLVLNVLYSFVLKNYSLFDIFMIGVFFEMRLVTGGLTAGVALTSWLVLMTFFLALFLAAAKRRDDIMLDLEDKRSLRKSLNNYNEYFLNALIILLSSIIIVTYLLYSISAEVVMRFGQHYYLTVFFPVLGVIRYLQIIFVFKSAGDPVKVLYKDRMLQAFILLWAALIFYFIYGNHV